MFDDGAHNVPLWLSAALPDDVAISVTAESRSPAVDLKVELFGNGADHASGYVVILSGWNNTKSIIARLDEHGRERKLGEDPRLAAEVAADPAAARSRHEHDRDIVARTHHGLPDHPYRFRIERRGSSLKFFVDGDLHLEYFDAAPLRGPGHDRFAFNDWESATYFDDLVIEPL